MANLSKVLIQEFSAGIQTSDRRSVQGGATLIKNFNIYEDGRRLKPVPAWESCTTEEEKGLNIIALGGNLQGQGSTTVLGLGSALSNWLSPSYDNRVLLTPQAAAPTSDYVFIDLEEHMPASFWSNVNTDGSDIIPTDATHTPLKFKLIDFDKVAQKGRLIVGSRIKDIYVYYGNQSATGTANTYLGLFDFNSALGSLWPLDGDETDYKGTFDVDDSLPYTPGITGLTIGSSYGGVAQGKLQTQNGVGGDLGDKAEFSAAISVTQYPSSIQFILGDNIRTLAAFIDNTGRIVVGYDTTGGGNSSFTSTSQVPIGRRSYITVQYDDDTEECKLWVNGVLDTVDTQGSGKLDSSSTEEFDIEAGTQMDGTFGEWDIEFVSLYRNSISKTDADGEIQGAMFASQSTFWTTGLPEQRVGITPTYSGTAIYEKVLGSGTGWQDYELGGLPVKTLDYYPQPAWLVTQSTGTNVIVRDNPDINQFGFRYVTELNTLGLTWDHYRLNGLDFTNMARISQAVDKDYYFSYDNSVNNLVGSAVTEDVFIPYDEPIHLTPYGQYMAVVSSRNYRSYCNIWDLDSTTSTEFIEIGQGNVRGVGNVYGTLFFLVNDGLNNSTLANDSASLDIRVWTGGSYAENFITLETTYNVDNYYTEQYEYPILNQVEYIKNAFVFYARIPDRNGNIQEGLWSIGKSETSQVFGLTLYKDTSALGDVTYIYRTGNVLFAIHGRDGSISRLSANDYSDLSIWESTKFIGSSSENVKKMMSAEITFEALEAGQEIVMYYRTTTDSDPLAWKELGRINEEGAVKKEITNIETNGNPLPSFNEIEFRLTSQNGASSITSWGFTFEDTTDLSN